MSERGESKDNKLICPHCGSIDVKDTGIGRARNSLRVKWSFKCRSCGKDFSALAKNAVIKNSD